MADLSILVDVQAKGLATLTSELDKLNRRLSDLERRNGGASDSTNELGRSSRNTAQSMGLLSKAIAGVVTFESIRGIVSMTDTMTNLRSQVRFVTLTYEEAAQAQARLLTISNDTRASLKATTTLYTRTARAMKDYGKTQEEVLVFTEAINNAMRVGGVSAGEQASALLQLSQALGSGRLQGDEFRSISENAPLILEVLAKNTGIARSELKKMGSEGKITSELLFNAISKSSEELKKQAALIPETFESALTKMKNNAMTYADDALNSNGVMTSLASGIIKVSENLNYVLIPILSVAGIAMARLTSTTVAGMAASSNAIAANTALLYRQQIVIAGIGGVSGNAARGFAAMTIATQALSKSLAFLGGPVGIAFLAASGISMYALSAKEAKKSTADFEMEISKLNESMKTMGEKDRAANLKLQESNLVSLKEKSIELGKELEALKRTSYKQSSSGTFWNPFGALEKDKEKTKKAIADISLEILKVNKLIGDTDDLISKLSGKQDLTKNIEGAGKASDEVLKIYNSLDKRMYSVNNKGLESELIYKRTRGELGEINDAWFNVLLSIAKVTTALEGQKKKSEELKSIISSVNEEYSNLGKTETQKIIAKAKINGASPDEINKLKDQRAAIDAYNESQKSSKSDPFGDRLRDMSEELSRIQAQNAEIARFGRESLYTSAQQLTLEFNNQSSALFKVSEAQKQLLMNQAVAVDSQKQLNSILELRSQYSIDIDQMNFELQLIGKTADAVEKLTFMRNLENKVKEISIGMNAENIELLNQEIQKIVELRNGHDALKDSVDGNIMGGMKDGFNQYVNSMGTVREQFATVTESMFGGLTDAISSFASGANKDFADMTRQVLQNISKMLIQMAILNAMKMAFGGFSLGSSISRGVVDIGGGIPYPQASPMVGMAHSGIDKIPRTGTWLLEKGERVITSNTSAKLDATLERINLMNSRNSNNPPSNQSSKDGDITINITQYEDGSQDVDVTKDGRSFEKFVKVTVQKEVANQMRSGGSLAKR